MTTLCFAATAIGRTPPVGKTLPRKISLSTPAELRTSQAVGQDDPIVLDNDGNSPPPNDPDQLHQLVVDHGDAVYRLALSIVSDRALAEDIAQEALVKAWLALPTLRDPKAIRGWILRITHNTSISMVRARKAIVTDPHDLPERPTAPSALVESRVEQGAAMEHFKSALENLDELSRSIVVLREIEGLSYDEIAELLRVPLPTVKTRLLRARKRLGTNLKEWA